MWCVSFLADLNHVYTEFCEMNSVPFDITSAIQELVDGGATAAGAALVVSMFKFRPLNGTLTVPRDDDMFRTSLLSVVDRSRTTCIKHFETAVASGSSLTDVMATLGASNLTVSGLGKKLGEYIVTKCGGLPGRRMVTTNNYIIELLLAAGYVGLADAAEWISMFGATGQVLDEGLAAKFADSRAGGEPVDPREIFSRSVHNMTVQAAEIALGCRYVGELSSAPSTKRARDQRRAELDALLTAALNENRTGNCASAVSMLRKSEHFSTTSGTSLYLMCKLSALTTQSETFTLEVNKLVKYMGKEIHTARQLITDHELAPASAVPAAVDAAVPAAAVPAAAVPAAAVPAADVPAAAVLAAVDADVPAAAVPAAVSAAAVPAAAVPAAVLAAAVPATTVPAAAVPAAVNDVTVTDLFAEIYGKLNMLTDAIAGGPSV